MPIGSADLPSIRKEVKNAMEGAVCATNAPFRRISARGWAISTMGRPFSAEGNGHFPRGEGHSARKGRGIGANRGR